MHVHATAFGRYALRGDGATDEVTDDGGHDAGLRMAPVRQSADGARDAT